MYKIYQFEVDNSIMVIPIAWVKGNMVPYAPSAAVQIRNKKKPNKNWKMYKVTEVDGIIYDSYDAALKAEAILSDKSDTNTDLEHEESKKIKSSRKRMQEKYYSSEEEENDDLPCVPIKMPCHNASEIDNAFNQVMRTDVNDIAVHNNSEFANALQYMDDMNIGVQPKDIEVVEVNETKDEIPAPVNEEVSFMSLPLIDTSHIEDIIRRIVKEELEIFGNKLKSMLNSSSITATRTHYVVFEKKNNFPLTTAEQIESFDEKLKSQDSLEEQFKLYILQIGGVTAKDSIKVLNRIYHLDLQKKISYTGREMKKYAVMNCTHIKILIETVTEHYKSTQKEVITLVQRYLQKTFDRVRAASNKENQNIC